MRYFRAAIDKYVLDRWVSYLVVERRHTHIVEVRGQHLSNEKLQLGLGKKGFISLKRTSSFESTVQMVINFFALVQTIIRSRYVCSQRSLSDNIPQGTEKNITKKSD